MCVCVSVCLCVCVLPRATDGGHSSVSAVSVDELKLDGLRKPLSEAAILDFLKSEESWEAGRTYQVQVMAGKRKQNHVRAVFQPCSFVLMTAESYGVFVGFPELIGMSGMLHKSKGGDPTRMSKGTQLSVTVTEWGAQHPVLQAIE